ncbi:MAG: hypothetical protein ACI8RD_009236 [Bacillariaceae sp.]|jgi:hypothetical protein
MRLDAPMAPSYLSNLRGLIVGGLFYQSFRDNTEYEKGRSSITFIHSIFGSGFSCKILIHTANDCHFHPTFF